MTRNILSLLLASICAIAISAKPKTTVSPVVEPPMWWTDMADHSLQIMVNYPEIRDLEPKIEYNGVNVDSIVRLDSPNYQLIYLNVSSEAKPGTINIGYRIGKKHMNIPFELRERNTPEFTPFDASDLLYLIMPDRFADGNPSNNDVASLKHRVEADRMNPNGRHGGDICGIEQHLGYIDSIGVTAIWLTPVLENDMPHGSYHGYATTNYYRVDPRLGSNDDYKHMIGQAHKRGIKVVMDMIFNHTGVAHKWMDDMPAANWYNNPKGDKMTNFFLSTVNDPYASDYDFDHTVNGWFVPSMPDLNQRNPHVIKHLIQNSIWWIEEAQIDGIRMDTHPYADMEAMASWLAAVERQYPGYNIVGECWYGNVAGSAFWQKDSKINRFTNSNLKTVMDFPTMIMAREAFGSDTRKYSQGLNAIYERLSQDYLYPDPMKVLTFLENHDSDRFLLSLPDNLGQWKQAIAFLLTTRGIPQLYYGQELLMNGSKEGSDGYVRKDVKGGFPGDTSSEFTAEGRTQLQNEAFDYLSRIAHWRRSSEIIAKGSLKHFIPYKGIYVYERRLGNKNVVVVMNGTDDTISIDFDRYNEVLPIGTTRTDVVTGKSITINEVMNFSPRKTLILE
ncbi:MAG: glycoside hydrolase family 13 protein [Muribaculaceae bacterium]